MNWFDIYKKDINRLGGLYLYTAFKRFKYRSYIALVKKYLKTNDRIIEAGSGTGSIISYFAKNYSATGIDMNTDMLSLAKSRLDNTGYIEHDILKPLATDIRVDVAFSNGVLEHFSDLDVIKAIDNQLDYSKTVIFSVPTVKFTEEDRIYGNERFLTYEKWLKLIDSSSGRLADSYAGYLFLFQYRYIDCRILSTKLRDKADFWVFVLESKS